MWIFKKNESFSVLQQFNGGLYSYCTWDHLTRHHSTGNFTRLSSAADSPLVLFHLFTFSSLLISPAKHTHLFTMTVSLVPVYLQRVFILIVLTEDGETCVLQSFTYVLLPLGIRSIHATPAANSSFPLLWPPRAETALTGWIWLNLD